MDNQVLLTVIERPTISSLNITGAKMLQNDAIKKTLKHLVWRNPNTSTKQR